MASNVGLGVCLAIGVILRLSLFRTDIPQWFSNRVEISNALTSWQKALDGISLADNDISPYSGDLFHETPIMLRVFSFVTKLMPNKIHYFFVFIDILSGLVIASIGKHFSRYLLQKQLSEVKKYAVGVEKIIVKKDDVDVMQMSLVAAHFLNPYSIAVCLGKSTAVINNLFIYLSFMFMLKGNQWLCMAAIAFASYQSLYPIMLVVPAAIFFNTKLSNAKKSKESATVPKYGGSAMIGIALTAALFIVSYFMEHSWKFLHATTGFILGVPDLTPNMGVFWYFFTEMFEHFRPFFICVFQINAFLYTVPLAIKLRDHPVFLAYVLVTLMSIFKSYPSYADVAIFVTLLPMWRHVFTYMRNTFIVTNMFLCCTVLSPILWHLWIYAGSANANFYFAIALTFSTAQIFLITDLLFAYLRREFDLKNGIKHKIDGKDAQVILD
ncbi:phosphatidylinositol glycan anchor biosynthesis class U protein-like [Mercenaria mercenaria]|uniref:phosphatidylinositol glycan anchor biosynthesis class U protein-like n=1 Tax=Mercenaria mercenaria TaxID=6596 RepID=UPI00234EC12F|nr:phosphatidylinositol glycan anchor biosynthesis class U protein-like [Mercenaria mercenaria]